MKALSLVAFALFAGTSTAATAGPTWSYAEAGYVYVNPDGIDNGNGFGLRGSVAFSDQWHVFARYDDASVDILFGGDIDISRTSIGFGFNNAISDRTDFVARLAYERADADSDRFGVSADGSGFSLFGGLRGHLTDAFVLGGGLEYADVEDSGDLVLKLEGQYLFTESFAGSFEVEAGDDGQSIFIGPRLTF